MFLVSPTFFIHLFNIGLRKPQVEVWHPGIPRLHENTAAGRCRARASVANGKERDFPSCIAASTRLARPGSGGDVGSEQGAMMNVLEIYPNFAWWFDAADIKGIERLRAAAKISDLTAQSGALDQLRPAQAYYLVGDAATFDLIPGVFDEIVLCYEPAALKRLILDRRIHEWIGTGGAIRSKPTVLQLHDAGHSTFDASLPMKLAKLRRW